RHGIPIVEDAAEAIGSVWHGKRAGSMGVFGVFSFHGTKTITTGEGGMFVTNDPDLYERVLTLSNHGRARGETRQFWPSMVGFKYKMSNIQAAIGCAQMERIDELIAGKRRVFKYYEYRLRDLPVRMNPEPEGTVNGYWMATVVVDERVRFDREDLLKRLKEHNIDGRVFFWPLSTLTLFERESKNRVASGLHERAFNLPSYHDLLTTEMDSIIQVIKNCVG
ncbi:glutamine--scyllo-inositol aminotransferase, partial [Candidatus Parcubacteria bacterium]